MLKSAKGSKKVKLNFFFRFFDFFRFVDQSRSGIWIFQNPYLNGCCAAMKQVRSYFPKKGKKQIEKKGNTDRWVPGRRRREPRGRPVDPKTEIHWEYAGRDFESSGTRYDYSKILRFFFSISRAVVPIFLQFGCAKPISKRSSGIIITKTSLGV